MNKQSPGRNITSSLSFWTRMIVCSYAVLVVIGMPPISLPSHSYQQLCRRIYGLRAICICSIKAPNTAFSELAPVPPWNMTTRHAGVHPTGGSLRVFWACSWAPRIFHFPGFFFPAAGNVHRWAHTLWSRCVQKAIHFSVDISRKFSRHQVGNSNTQLN